MDDENLRYIKGAVADENTVGDFLRNDFTGMVPDKKACNLRDEEATHINIIEAIKSFVSNDNMKMNDPISFTTLDMVPQIRRRYPPLMTGFLRSPERVVRSNRSLQHRSYLGQGSGL